MESYRYEYSGITASWGNRAEGLLGLWILGNKYIIGVLSVLVNRLEAGCFVADTGYTFADVLPVKSWFYELLF